MKKQFFRIMLFTIALLSAKLLNEANIEEASAQTATIEDGKILFSVDAPVGSTSGWRYKTIGFTLTEVPAPNGDPNQVPHTEIMYLEEKGQTDLGNGMVKVDFEIPAATVVDAMQKAGLGVPQSGETVYLHGVFQLIPPNQTEPSGEIYTTLDGIMNAKPWSDATRATLPGYFNIAVTYHAAQGTVTINHVDYDTGEVLLVENFKVDQAMPFSFTSKPKGHFTKDGEAYVAYPETQTATGTMPLPPQNLEYTFVYRLTKSDPSGERDYTGGTEGGISGDVSWRLTPEGTLEANNNMKQSGNHYATRNEATTITANDQVINGNEATFDPEIVQNTEITFKFSYEYTNKYYEKYEPVFSEDGEVYEWELVSTTPMWEYAQTAEKVITLDANHRYEETIELSSEESTIQLLIGQSAQVDGEVSNQYETIDVGSREKIELETQMWVPLIESISYKSDFNEAPDLSKSESYYFPVDIDENLKEQFTNDTDFSHLGNYAIPLVLEPIPRGDGGYTISITTANDFYLSEKTGVIMAAEKGASMEEVIKMYEDYFEDIGGYYDAESDVPELKEGKYYIPIDGDSDLLPETEYKNYYTISNIGLSGIDLVFDQVFSFEEYLIGSVFDDAYATEEPMPVIDVAYSYSVVVSDEQIKSITSETENRGEKIHGFKNSDAYLINEMLSEELNIKDIN